MWIFVEVAKFDSYPMPWIEVVVESVGSSTAISTLNLAKGYWQIPVTRIERKDSLYYSIWTV